MSTTSTSTRARHEEIKARYLQNVIDAFKALDLETLRTGSAEISVPVLDKDQNEEWLVITLKVPTGTRDGDAYDGYAMAQDYAMKQEAKAEKAKESARKKAEKIAKDKAAREAKAKAKATRA